VRGSVEVGGEVYQKAWMESMNVNTWLAQGPKHESEGKSRVVGEVKHGRNDDDDDIGVTHLQYNRPVRNSKENERKDGRMCIQDRARDTK